MPTPTERFNREYALLSAADHARLRETARILAIRHYHLDADDLLSEAEAAICSGDRTWPTADSLPLVMHRAMWSISQNWARKLWRQQNLQQVGGSVHEAAAELHSGSLVVRTAEDNIVWLEERSLSAASILNLFGPDTLEHTIARRMIEGCTLDERREGMTKAEYQRAYNRLMAKLKRKRS